MGVVGAEAMKAGKERRCHRSNPRCLDAVTNLYRCAGWDFIISTFQVERQTLLQRQYKKKLPPDT